MQVVNKTERERLTFIDNDGHAYDCRGSGVLSVTTDPSQFVVTVLDRDVYPSEVHGMSYENTVGWGLVVTIRDETWAGTIVDAESGKFTVRE
jgi:hypothetical protein